MSVSALRLHNSKLSRCINIIGGSLAFAASASAAFGICPPQEVARLFPTSGRPGDFFGVSTSIFGDTIVVGNPDDDTPRGINAGSAHVFTRVGGSWAYTATLTASDGGASDWFGSSVSLSGDTIAVGALGDNTSGGVNAGSVYVFVRNGATWTQQAHLFASDGSAGDQFGNSVALVGDTLIITANYDDTPAGADAGSAYVFVRNGTQWSEVGRLFAADASEGDSFGTWSGFAPSGSDVVIGAFADDTPGGTDAGSAYVFQSSNGSWAQTAHLFASDGATDDKFGYAVEVFGDTIAVGAFQDDTSAGEDAGSVYVFQRSGEGWEEQAHLTASDGMPLDRFCSDIAVSTNTIVVSAELDDTSGGADAGSAYVFERRGSSWIESLHIIPPDTAGEDHFGYAVEISADTVVLTAWGQDSPQGTNAGLAHVFELHTCRPDFDCDGFVSGIDFDLYVAAFESGETTADFDADGFLTGIDFDLFVAAFDAGC